jgi:homoserine O-succinyltransferase
LLILNKNMPVIKELNETIKIKEKDGKFSVSKKSKKILILNLMPNKIKTEFHILRLLDTENRNIEIEPFFMKLDTHKYKNTDKDYLEEFYVSFEEIKNLDIEAAIITGAPLEKIKFEEVGYWEELKKIFKFIDNLKSSIFICWGSQAALYYYHNIPKHEYKCKKFGVFNHNCENNSGLFKNLKNEDFKIPHSRYTYVKREDIKNNSSLKILLSDENNEPVIVKDNNKIYISGHMEYDRYNLRDEYLRDINNNIEIDIPKNYFLNDKPENSPVFTWEKFSKVFYSNWLLSF